MYTPQIQIYSQPAMQIRTTMQSTHTNTTSIKDLILLPFSSWARRRSWSEGIYI